LPIAVIDIYTLQGSKSHYSINQHTSMTQSEITHVVVRSASKGNDCGEGIEVAKLSEKYPEQHPFLIRVDSYLQMPELSIISDDETILSTDSWELIGDQYNSQEPSHISDDDTITEDGSQPLSSFVSENPGTTISIDNIPSIPLLLERLRHFLPHALSENNFWLKFSLINDGASLPTLLQKIKGARHCIIAVETLDGEVFGSFTSSPWEKQWGYFGSGEAFLWRLEDTSQVDVFPWSGQNNMVQFCDGKKVVVGGGDIDCNMSGRWPGANKPSNSASYGFGLVIETDLQHGASNPCMTFNSPSLSKVHFDGSPFEISNIEVWAMTPCASVEEAKKLELRQSFLGMK